MFLSALWPMFRSEDVRCRWQAFDPGAGCGPCRGGGGNTHRLMGVGSEGEKRRGHRERPRPLVVALATHLPLAIAAHARRVDRQQFSQVIP
jgi:hypothetical protein